MKSFDQFLHILDCSVGFVDRAVVGDVISHVVLRDLEMGESQIAVTSSD